MPCTVRWAWLHMEWCHTILSWLTCQKAEAAVWWIAIQCAQCSQVRTLIISHMEIKCKELKLSTGTYIGLNNISLLFTFLPQSKGHLITAPSRHFWDDPGWESGLSIVIWDSGRWKSGPCQLGCAPFTKYGSVDFLLSGVRCYLFARCIDNIEFCLDIPFEVCRM